MAAAPIKSKGATLDPAIVKEVTDDWNTDAVQKGEVASEVAIVLEDFATARSNRGYDVVEVARAAASTAMGAAYKTKTKGGMFIGSKTWTDTVEDTPAVTDKEGNVTTPAVTHDVLHVQTYWKTKTS